MKLKAEDILVGADPEFFTWSKTDKAMRSCHTFMKGTKYKPFPLKNGAVQVDGTAIEFNIHPTNDPKQFAKNIGLALGEVRKMVPKEYEFKFVPHVIYDKEYFKTIPDENKELGCDPDYSTHASGRVNPKPVPKGDYETMRTGAGHIHLGWTKDQDIKDEHHLFDARIAASSIDGFMRSTNLYKLWDTDVVRNKLYGGNGAYRPKPYGVEYRDLSNAWLNYPKLWPWLAEVCQQAVSYTSVNGYTPAIYTDSYSLDRAISGHSQYQRNVKSYKENMISEYNSYRGSFPKFSLELLEA